MPSQNVVVLALGVAAVVVPAGQAVQADAPVAYVFAAHVTPTDVQELCAVLPAAEVPLFGHAVQP